MFDNTENYFYCNCNQQTQKLYFREWVSSVYLLSVKVLRKANLNRAEAQYHYELEKGIELCNRSSLRNKYKLEDILLQFDAMFKNTGTVSIEGYSAGDLLSGIDLSYTRYNTSNAFVYLIIIRGHESLY
ncbi:37120_t:CDS:2 [Gigaspora margarita]|uniref:37120_t:CDS:1 n=1 Tax=Gigaspora margarita TaxID=4874 RepID=A0ABN7VDE7_GIGMA|nr:37120_t:CDS:2 [Gigaspora margarita]